MSDKESHGVQIGFCGALFLLFLGLRLTDNIDWAWYWIAAPLWIPLALVLTILFVLLSVYGIAAIIDGIAAAKRRAKREASHRSNLS